MLAIKRAAVFATVRKKGTGGAPIVGKARCRNAYHIQASNLDGTMRHLWIKSG
jgi:hypothetical protein